MVVHERVDPAVVAYLGGVMALLKLWLAESKQAAETFTDDIDSPEHPAMAPFVQQLHAIRDTAAALNVPAACQAAQTAFLAAMDQGLAGYLVMVQSEAREQKRIAMLGGVENFAAFDIELARLEEQFGPFDED